MNNMQSLILLQNQLNRPEAIAERLRLQAGSDSAATADDQPEVEE
ncbi:hypothetical protein MASR1M12_04760 [Erysipelotrichia bacterium]